MNENTMQSLSSQLSPSCKQTRFFPLSKATPRLSGHCECMACASSWQNHCSALIQGGFFILWVAYSPRTVLPILAFKNNSFFSVRFHLWAHVACSEVLSCLKHLHGFWEQASGSALCALCSFTASSPRRIQPELVSWCLMHKSTCGLEHEVLLLLSSCCAQRFNVSCRDCYRNPCG